MRSIAILAAFIAALVPASLAAQDAERSVERGRYLVTITGCNDCHTDGYADAKGDVPETDWLMGSPVGFRGPWGTSYAINLRIGMSRLSDDNWLRIARRNSAWPPMPWYNMQKMSDADLLSILDFIMSLGRAGTEMPKVVYPGKDPGGGVYISFPVRPSLLSLPGPIEGDRYGGDFRGSRLPRIRRGCRRNYFRARLSNAPLSKRRPSPDRVEHLGTA